MHQAASTVQHATRCSVLFALRPHRHGGAHSTGGSLKDKKVMMQLLLRMLAAGAIRNQPASTDNRRELMELGAAPKLLKWLDVGTPGGATLEEDTLS